MKSSLFVALAALVSVISFAPAPAHSAPAPLHRGCEITQNRPTIASDEGGTFYERDVTERCPANIAAETPGTVLKWQTQAHGDYGVKTYPTLNQMRNRFCDWTEAFYEITAYRTARTKTFARHGTCSGYATVQSKKVFR